MSLLLFRVWICGHAHRHGTGCSNNPQRAHSPAQDVSYHIPNLLPDREMTFHPNTNIAHNIKSACHLAQFIISLQINLYLFIQLYQMSQYGTWYLILTHLDYWNFPGPVCVFGFQVFLFVELYENEVFQVRERSPGNIFNRHGPDVAYSKYFYSIATVQCFYHNLMCFRSMHKPEKLCVSYFYNILV